MDHFRDFEKQSKPFRIPVDEKEEIKLLLRDYTTSPLKKMRTNRQNELTHEELKPLVKKLESIIQNNNSLDEKAKLQEKSKLYVTTGYLRNPVVDDLISSINEEIRKKVDWIRTEGHVNFLTHSDSIALLQHYKQKIIEASQQWFELTQAVADLRETELFQILDQNTLSDDKQSFFADDILILEDTHVIIHNAYLMLREEYKQPTSLGTSREHLERVRLLIEQRTK